MLMPLLMKVAGYLQGTDLHVITRNCPSRETQSPDHWLIFRIQEKSQVAFTPGLFVLVRGNNSLCLEQGEVDFSLTVHSRLAQKPRQNT